MRRNSRAQARVAASAVRALHGSGRRSARRASAGDGRAIRPLNEPRTAGLAGRVEIWLSELGVVPLERAEREGTTSWDLLLDSRRRRRIRLTLILDPRLALVGWVHYAPPLADSFRKTYRQLLRWNDELPFAKFAISEDDRPALTAELAVADVERDQVGLLIARLLAICDLLYAESATWVDRIKTPPREVPTHNAAAAAAGTALLDRYAAQLAELVGEDTEEERGGA